MTDRAANMVKTFRDIDKFTNMQYELFEKLACEYENICENDDDDYDLRCTRK